MQCKWIICDCWDTTPKGLPKFPERRSWPTDRMSAKKVASEWPTNRTLSREHVLVRPSRKTLDSTESEVMLHLHQRARTELFGARSALVGPSAAVGKSRRSVRRESRGTLEIGPNRQQVPTSQQAQSGLNGDRATPSRSSRPIGRPRVPITRDEAVRLRPQGLSWREIAGKLGAGATTVRRAVNSSGPCQNPSEGEL